ncbi:MAG: hypothetical protein ABFD82_18385 [Syntrophaceae bacterium]|jgi:hypothetical protein
MATDKSKRKETFDSQTSIEVLGRREAQFKLEEMLLRRCYEDWLKKQEKRIK